MLKLYPFWFRILLIAATLLALLVIAERARGQELSDAPQPQTLDKRFVAVSVLTIGSAALDAWSTNRNLDHGYREQNPILGARPAKWNVWALTMGESAAWCTAGYFVKRATRKSPSRFVRNLWIVLPGLSFAGHSQGWIHNVAAYDSRYPRVP